MLRSFTKSGFLYYELGVQFNKPTVLIYSDKQTYSDSFSTFQDRTDYLTELNNELENAGVSLFNVPLTSIYINPNTLLSVKTSNDVLVLEFPWGINKNIKYINKKDLFDAYKAVQENLSLDGGINISKEITDIKDHLNKLQNEFEAVDSEVGDKADNDMVVHSKGVSYEKIEDDKDFCGIVNFLEPIPDGDSSDRAATTKFVTITVNKLKESLTTVMVYKGSVATEADLPTTDLTIGDTYNIESNGANFCWNGSNWDELGSSIDLTSYLTKTDAASLYSTKTDLDTLSDEVKSNTGRLDTVETSIEGIQTAIEDVATNTSVDSKFATHNLDSQSHNDIRNQITTNSNIVNDIQSTLTEAVDNIDHLQDDVAVFIGVSKDAALKSKDNEFTGANTFKGNIALDGIQTTLSNGTTLTDGTNGKNILNLLKIDNNTQQLYLGNDKVWVKGPDDILLEGGVINTKRPDTDGSWKEYTNIDSGNISQYAPEVDTSKLVTKTDLDNRLADITVEAASSDYGIRADYSTHYGITDCPNDIIKLGSGKRIHFGSTIILRVPNGSYGGGSVNLNSPGTYHDVSSVGNFILFYVKEDAEVVFREVSPNDVYWSTIEPPENGETRQYWWNPDVNVWQTRSNNEGNVWLKHQATPIANILATEDGITSVNYIGYRLINDDIIAQLSDIDDLEKKLGDVIDNVNETVNTSITDLSKRIDNEIIPNLDNKANSSTTLEGYGITDAYTKTEANDKFLTEHQSLENYATKEEIPTKTSELENDSGYLTSASDVVTSVNGYSGDVRITAIYTSNENPQLYKFWVGTKEEYEALESKAQDVIYYISDNYDCIDLEEVLARKQDNLIANTGISLVPDEATGNVVITNSAPNVQSDWNADSGKAQILNKPILSTVAISGSYNDLENKPTAEDIIMSPTNSSSIEEIITGLEADIDSRAMKATTAEGYGITDVYTKSEVYTKDQVDALIQDILGTIESKLKEI